MTRVVGPGQLQIPVGIRRPGGGPVPVYLERCPIHNQLVGFDGEWHAVGTCSGCAASVADALSWMAAHPYEPPAWLVPHRVPVPA